ncbi:Oxidoreductase [Malassezia pachydermatis]|uniref:Mitochondrial intermembrane space import and assembly protein 40 n=1 Tax=Malassezia pachydermatis TaxID=77020 RepID=A0A0N0RSG7_9BASI|nr:essential protein of the mitochondrial intermembrane space [Malassezia pachydermatis]KOS15279.1 essential protein of the mitochondrial intermembrane space [Malassezia pachydermatis]
MFRNLFASFAHTAPFRAAASMAPRRALMMQRVALPVGALLTAVAWTATQPVHLQPASERGSFVDRLKPREPPAIRRAEKKIVKEEDVDDVPETTEASSLDDDAQSAYDEKTGEINWDCPCLGGMAHGPCGEEFKQAFSCFVFSEAEPKGIDCVDKFKLMQDCFRQHPEVYADEIEADEAYAAEAAAEQAPSASSSEATSS